MGVEIALMSILALGGAGVYLGLRTLENYSPGRRKIQKDLAGLKKELASVVKDLVPMGEEELEQLSYNLKEKTSKSGVVKTTKGVFTTVYHEPLVAWVYRKYVSSKENSLVYAKTADLELIYRTKKKMTEVVVNDKLLGTIDESGAFRAPKSQKPIAHVMTEKKDTYFPVYIEGKEVGGLTDLATSVQVNPRAFQMLGKLNPEQKLLFLVLGIHTMVKMSI